MSKAPLLPSDAFVQTLAELAATIDARAGDDPSASYTAKLLQAGPMKCAKKAAEEGSEFALAVAAEDEAAVASEAGDVLYHLFVALRSRGVSLSDVAEALRARQGMSGLEEKASRSET